MSKQRNYEYMYYKGFVFYVLVYYVLKINFGTVL